jgi:hypothetical protein
MIPTEQDLKAPLKPGLEYFDATPCVEALAMEMRDLKAAMQVQGDMNLKLLDLLTNALNRIALLEENRQKPSALVLPPRLQ